jgi:hypothetical protein
MKNWLIVIGIAVVVVFFAACGKTNLGLNGGESSGTSSITSTNLIGQWYYTTDTINYYTGTTLDSSKYFAYFQSDYIQFNSNGTGVEMRSNVSNNFSYNITDQAITFLFPSGVKQLAVLPEKISTGGVRTLASSGTTITADIKALSTTNLVLVFNTSTGNNTSTTETAHFSN